MCVGNDDIGSGEFSVVENGLPGAVVAVRGELDYLNSGRFEALIEECRLAGKTPVIVDLTQCRYIDSTVLTVFVRANKSLGGALRIVIPTVSHLRRIFVITGLDNVMRIENDVESAGA